MAVFSSSIREVELNHDSRRPYEPYVRLTYFNQVPPKALRLAERKGVQFRQGRDASGRVTFTLEHGVPVETDYHFSSPSLKGKPELAALIDADGLAHLFSDRRNKLLVYTGAGTSNASIPDFKTFKKNLGMTDVADGVDRLALGIISNPSRVGLKWRVWTENFLRAEGQGPTEAHRLLAELQAIHPFTLATENVDLLHERAGSGVFHSVREANRGRTYVYSDIHDPESSVSRSIDGVTHIVTVGLSGDWYGFLKQVRERHPDAKIISIGQGRPAFLGPEDAHHEGDIPSVLRKLVGPR